MKHTPTPWKVINSSGQAEIRTADNKCPGIAYLGMVEDGALPLSITRDNASFIVQSVNSHEELLEALKRLMDVALLEITGFEQSETFRIGHEAIFHAEGRIKFDE